MEQNKKNAQAKNMQSKQVSLVPLTLSNPLACIGKPLHSLESLQVAYGWTCYPSIYWLSHPMYSCHTKP